MAKITKKAPLRRMYRKEKPWTLSGVRKAFTSSGTVAAAKPSEEIRVSESDHFFLVSVNIFIQELRKSKIYNQPVLPDATYAHTPEGVWAIEIDVLIILLGLTCFSNLLQQF